MNKKVLLIILAIVVLAVLATPILADKPVSFDEKRNEIAWQNSSCTKIQSGELLTSAGDVLTTGFDVWGYNYQAHMFNGTYCDAYRDAAWCQPYKEDNLMIKWNDAWLSNVDCDGDGLLDRHYGYYASYVGSGAWLTNHVSGEYDLDGEMCSWNYFVKIVAAPADATAVGGVWYAADGTEMGPAIWGEFAVIQEVSNDPCGGEHGLLYKGEVPTGFGFYSHKKLASLVGGVISPAFSFLISSLTTMQLTLFPAK